MTKYQNITGVVSQGLQSAQLHSDLNVKSKKHPVCLKVAPISPLQASAGN